MLRTLRLFSLCVAASFLMATLSQFSSAATIIKLSLSSSPIDIEFDGTTLSTADDGVVTTAGDQNTSALFIDFLDSKHADILATDASFSLNGLATAGLATPFPTVNPVLVIQNFTGGTFSLFDTDNTVLLTGSLDDSTLTGPIGPPATGALFTTSFGQVTGGTLAPYIDPTSLTLSMNFTQINGGAGFSLGSAAPSLNPFTADASVNIAGEVPEPMAAALVLLGVALGGLGCRCRS